MPTPIACVSGDAGPVTVEQLDDRSAEGEIAAGYRSDRCASSLVERTCRFGAIGCIRRFGQLQSLRQIVGDETHFSGQTRPARISSAM
jgi:hypothetical protein